MSIHWAQEMEVAQRERIVAAARRYVGTPFRHMGRSEHGVDCVGLLIVAAKASGFLPRDYETRNYSRVVNPDVLAADLAQFLRPLPADAAPRPADVALFCVAGSAQHVGLVTATLPEPRILHAYEPVGAVVEHAMGEIWRRRLARLFRWKEFAWPR